MRSTYFTAVTVGLLLTIAGSRAAATDLLEAYRLAQSHDARLAAARAAFEAGKEKLPQGRSQLLPTLTLNGSKFDYDASVEYEGTTTFQGGARRYTNEEYELALTQPLYRKQNFAAYEQGKAQAAAAAAQFSQAQQELILRVAQAYFDVLAAADRLATAAAQKASLSAQHDQARARLTAGVAPITEAHEAKARADLAAADEIAAQSELEVKRRVFWKITGALPERLGRLGAESPLPPIEPSDLQAWVTLALDRNPQLTAHQYDVEAAEQELERARGGHYPSLDLVAGYSNTQSSGSVYTSARSDTSWKRAGLQLQVPLSQGGYVNSRVRETAALRDRAREEREEARREITVQVQQFYVGLTHGQRQIEALGQALRSSESALEATQASYRVGVRNAVDVLNATHQFFTVQRDLSRARYDYLLSLLKLKAAAGTLAEADLGRFNDLLERTSGL